MRDGRPSLTASVVSLARGLGEDTVAERLLPRPFAVALHVLRGVSGRALWMRPLVNAATGGLVDHVMLRTAEIDEALRGAIARGTNQVVILGAGLDARAYRMGELADAVVFEVDHPRTQEYKELRVLDLMPTAKDVRFVSVDFEHDDLSEALARAGHRADAPTFWIWEGVTPYLEREAVRTSLEGIALRSAKQSGLAMTYGDSEATLLRVGSHAVSAAFGVIGEPLRGLMTGRDAAEELARAGFRILSDRGPEDWARSRNHSRAWALVIPERLAVAVRD